MVPKLKLPYLLFSIVFSLSCVYSQQWITYNTDNSGVPSNTINRIEVDKEHNAWLFEFYTDTLVRFDGVQFIRYTQDDEENILLGVRSLSIDRNDNVWLGFPWCGRLAGGVSRYGTGAWTYYDVGYSSLSGYSNISALVMDNQNNLWIGRSVCNGIAGMDKFNTLTDVWQNYSHSNSPLPQGDITSFALDHDTNLWIGIDGGGLAKFNRVNIWEVFDSAGGELPSNRVTNLCVDRANNVWCSTLSGLVKYDNVSQWQTYTRTNSRMPAIFVDNVLQDTKGTIWISSIGISKMVGDTFVSYDTANSMLPSTFVYDLACDSSGNLWIGTDNGLAIFNEDGISVEVARKIQGRSSLAVYPNPFNASTTIRLTGIGADQAAKGLTGMVEMVNIRGIVVYRSRLDQASLDRGYCWNPKSLNSGVYFIRVLMDGKVYSKKALLLQ